MALTDNCPMPFGKHKGIAMANVPATYLEWCKKKLYPNTQGAREVLSYVQNNWDAIKKELDKEDNDE